LTPAGARLAGAARPLLAEADALRAGLADIEPSPPGLLRVGLMLDGAGAATAPMLAAFRAHHPETTIRVQRLHADRVVDALLDATVDVAQLHGPTLDPHIEVLALFTEPRIAAVSARSHSPTHPPCLPPTCSPHPPEPAGPGSVRNGKGSSPSFPSATVNSRTGFGDPTANLDELLFSIGLDGLFLTMPAHLADTYRATCSASTTSPSRTWHRWSSASPTSARPPRWSASSAISRNTPLRAER
jgi:DNA-binding transcriptional LysR family regulator